MGFFARLFGRQPKAGSKTAKVRGDQALDALMGVAGAAKVSRRGHPVCPQCRQEFPVAAETMRAQSDGIPVFACPGCGAMIRV